MARLLPRPERVKRDGRAQLEVQAAAADSTVDDRAIECLQLGEVLVDEVGDVDERLRRGLAAAVVLPLAPPLAADVLKLADRDTVTQRALSNEKKMVRTRVAERDKWCAPASCRWPCRPL